MCVLNGCFNESDNNFTSVSTRGKAVADYICVPHDADVLEKCEYYKLKVMRSVIEDGKLTSLLCERSKTPDHSALITEIRVSHFPRSRQPVNNNTRDRKKYKLNSIPQEFLSSDLSELALQAIISKMESARETQN